MFVVLPRTASLKKEKYQYWQVVVAFQRCCSFVGVSNLQAPKRKCCQFAPSIELRWKTEKLPFVSPRGLLSKFSQPSPRLPLLPSPVQVRNLGVRWSVCEPFDSHSAGHLFILHRLGVTARKINGKHSELTPGSAKQTNHHPTCRG